jgi:hypothetical protein
MDVPMSMCESYVLTYKRFGKKIKEERVPIEKVL